MRTPATLAMLVTTALAVSAPRAPAQDDAPAALLDSGFEDGWGEWRQVGEADFTLDEAEPHGGARSAMIRLVEGATPAYQRIEHTLGAVKQGDQLAVTFWVRSEGVVGPGGAYGALEFQNAAGERCGIFHSSTSAGNGANGWQELTMEGTAPAEAATASVHLVLHSVGSAWFDDVRAVRTGRLVPWPDLGDQERAITIHADQVVQERFGGVGFHVFDHIFATTREQREQVIEKRWREMAPSFARMNDSSSWDQAMLDRAADYMLRLRDDTQTELYVTTWDPDQTKPGEERAAYARRVADRLDYWVKQRGCTNIRTYCMTNELSLGGWGTLASDLGTFRDYHRELRTAFDAKGLDVGLLATDASPVEWWNSVEWATREMDDITAVYGGHNYFNAHEPTDERFYPWFLAKLDWGVGLARSMGKDFILGEFGCRQDGRTLDGVKRDVCIFWDTPLEPIVGLQLADTVIAALNAGVYGMGYWTYMDFPDDYAQGYINKWGTFRWDGKERDAAGPTPIAGFGTRDHYYAYGLLTRFFRGPAEVYRVETSDPWLRAAALRHSAGTWSIAVVSRARETAPIRVAVAGASPSGRFRKYVYDSTSVPRNPFGDLQGPSAVVEMVGGVLADSVPPGALVVYTTAYEDEAPPVITGLRQERTDEGVRLAWDPSPAADLCYYRVYRGGEGPFEPTLANQIASTIGTELLDRRADTGTSTYHVIAVDRSGNAGAWQ